MNTRISRQILVCAVLGLLYPGDSTADPVWRTLPQLVHDAHVIAQGTISIEADKYLLQIDEMLKGQAAGRLIVRSHLFAPLHGVEFHNGEAVLLFLEIPDSNGMAYLLGSGDQGKWPKTPGDPNHQSADYPRLLTEAPLEKIHNVAGQLLAIENAGQLDQKVTVCTKYIRSADPLLQYVAMQYAGQGLLWPPSPENPYPRVSHELAKRRFDILRKLSEDAISLVDSNEPSVRAESVRLLRYARVADAMPKLIKRITDSDLNVRSSTRIVLGTIAREYKIQDSFVDFDHRDTQDRLQPAQKAWNDW